MNDPLEKEKFLNVPEAAEFLNVSRSTLERMYKAEEIPHYRIRGSVKFSIEKHLKPFLEKCEVSNAR